MGLLDKILEDAIVPIIINYEKEYAVTAAKAMVEGGRPVLEILQRHADSETALEAVAKQVPDVIVGAGSVMNVEHCKKVLDLGAKFIVSAGLDEDTVKYCIKRDIPILPGAVTPTEIQKACNLGVTVAKYFPLFNMGGAEMLKISASPYPKMKFLVSGDIEYRHLEELIPFEKIAACGGAWMFYEDGVMIEEYSTMVKIMKDSINKAREIRVS